MFETDYAYLDAGNGERLERFGETLTVRPAPMAVWDRALDTDLWNEAALTCSRPEHEKAHWSRPIPAAWPVHFGPIRMELVPSSNGQLGVFPEQQPNWYWVHERLRRLGRPLRILNGFAYTGGMTLAAAAAHPQVEICHLDGARSSVARARKNAAASGLSERPIRWITEDVMTFLEKEERRKRRYDALIFDPPAFGRGPKGKTWKMERDLDRLLLACAELLSEAPLFILISCHIPGWTSEDLASRLRSVLPAGTVEHHPLTLTSACGGCALPLGLSARWEPKEKEGKR